MSMFRIPVGQPRRQRKPAQPRRILQLELLEMRCVLNGTFTQIDLTQYTGPQALGTLLLLPDGTVLAHESETPTGTTTANRSYLGADGWWRLTPGASGSYDPVSGGASWTQMASMKDKRAFFACQVLPSGKVLVLGSECPKVTTDDDWKTVELFDPAAPPANAWTKGQHTRNLYPNNGSRTTFITNGNTYVGYIGAEATKLLPSPTGDTQILVPMEGTGPTDPNSNGNVNQIYHVEGDYWSDAADRRDPNYLPQEPSPQAGEECWVQLPDGSILTTDSNFQSQNMTARRYIPSSDIWTRTSNLPVALRDGPAVLVPGTRSSSNEKAWYTGYTQDSQGNYIFNTAYYDVTNGTWTAQTPDVATGLLAWDTPAAVLPTGQVLIVTGPQPDTDPITNTSDDYPAPYYAYEFCPNTGSFGSQLRFGTTGSGPTGRGVAEVSPFYCHMLVLPTGQILMADGIGHHLDLYTHAADANNDLAPTSLQPGITGISNGVGNQFSLSGYRLNGVTEGAYYGDDASMSSNYPLIRFKSISSSYIYYGITSGWSRTEVQAPGDTSQMTMNFTMSPSFYQNVGGVYDGQYIVEVVTNGIPSSPWRLTKQGTTNSWASGLGPSGAASPGSKGRVVLLPVVNQATVVPSDNAVTLATPSDRARELRLERSGAGGEIGSQQTEWSAAVARVLGGQVKSPDSQGTELACFDLCPDPLMMLPVPGSWYEGKSAG